MARKITPAAVVRQRILSVLASTGPGSLDSEEAKERLGRQFSWTPDDQSPHLGVDGMPPAWQVRANLVRNKMESKGELAPSFTDEDNIFRQQWALSDLGWAEAARLKTGDAAGVKQEYARREQLWESLKQEGGPEDVSRGLLRQLRLYNGASGIFVHQEETKTLSAPNGAAVSFMHTGKNYDDELSSTGLIYHYPRTNRAGHDESEIAAAKAAYQSGLPVFVITPGLSRTKRTVHRGYIEEVDDERGVLLVTFAEGELPPPPTKEELESAFQATDEGEPDETYSLRRNRPNQVRFAFQVFKRYGEVCAVCAVDVAGVVQAAHLVAKGKRGSDDPRNGLPLCANHHLAFDRGYWCMDPDLKLHAKADGPALGDLAIIRADLSHLAHLPHAEALSRVWTEWQPKHQPII